MTATYGPIRSRSRYHRCTCAITYADGHGTVEWEAHGKAHAIALVAEQVGRCKERGHSVQSAAVTTARGSVYNVLALLRED